MRFALALFALFTLAPVAEAASSAPTCPAGKLQRVRVSEIIPDGSLAGFRAAFADHAKWYAQHGYTADRLSLLPAVNEYGRNHARKGKVRVVIIHSRVSNVPHEKQDNAWKAFAQKYKANSRIVLTTLTCMA